MSPEYIPVPAIKAHQISEKYDKQMVIIISFDHVHQMIHATTSGWSTNDKFIADFLRKFCVQQLGGDLSKRIQFEDLPKR